jgi:hypothetical protein
MRRSFVRVSAVGRESLLATAFAAAFLTGIAGSAALAASQTALPVPRQQAPIGHRQPNAASVPASPSEPSMTLEDTDIDNKLNICRGC